MHDSLLLVGPRVSFFEGALPRKGELGRATTRPNQEGTTRVLQVTDQEAPTRSNQITSQEAIRLTDPGGRADHTRHNQGGFRSVTSAKGIITVTKPGHIANRTACVHTSWWQTSPICSQLALFDKRPMGARDCPGLPVTPESLASTQHSSTHAVERGPVTSFKGRGTKSDRKRGCGSCRAEPSTPDQPPFCGAQKRRRMAANNRFKETESISPNVIRNISTECNTQEFLHGQGGLKGRLSNRSSGSKIPLPVGFSKRHGVFKISNPPIRTLHRSLCLLKDNKTSSPILTSSRYSYHHLSRRYAAGITNRKLISSRFINSPVAFLRSRLCNQHQKLQ